MMILNKKSFLSQCLLIVFLCFFNLSFANNDEIKPLNLTLNHGVPVRLAEPAATIAIGDPDLFNAITLENNLLMITGEKIGATSLTIIGKSGTIYQYRVQVNRDISQLRSMIRSMERGVTVDDLNGRIVLQGQVDTPAALVRVLTMADRFLSGGEAQPDFKVVSDYGGVLAGNLDERINQLDPRVFRPLTQSSTPNAARRRNNNMLEDKANLAQNISRASVVSVAGGQILSFIKVTSQPKVEIQMRIVEIDRSKTDEFGISWRLDGSKVSVGSFHGGVVDSLPSPTSANSDGTDVGSANLVGFFTPGKYSLSAFVRAVEEKGATSTLSEPLLTAVSGESTRFLVGGTIPIPEQEVSTNQNGAVGITTNAGFLTYGMNIVLRPTVLENGKISVVLDQSISAPDYATAIQIVGAQVPGFKQKSVSTITESESGETWAVAGLLTEEDRKSLKSVPWISKVPILGKLFENKDDSVSRNELIILVNARRVDDAGSTTNNFEGHGSLEPNKPKFEESIDPIYSDKNQQELNSNSAITPAKKNTVNDADNTSQKSVPVNKDSSSKEKNKNILPQTKSKKIAAESVKPPEEPAIKIVNLREKSQPVSHEKTDVGTNIKVASEEKSSEKPTADLQIFSFDPEKIIQYISQQKIVVEKNPASENGAVKLVASNQTEPVAKTATDPKPQTTLKPEAKVIQVSTHENAAQKKDAPLVVNEKPATPAPQEVAVKISPPTPPQATVALNPPNTEQTAQHKGQFKLPTEADIRSGMSNSLEKVKVVVVNFLAGQEKAEFFAQSLKKGLTNVPPKSEWVNWKVGVGAVNGDTKKLVRFAVSPEMRGQIYSGASAYIEVPKSQFQYAADYQTQ